MQAKIVKTLLLGFLLALTNPCHAGDWTTGDTWRQSGATVLIMADWAQTRYTVKHPADLYASDSVIGRHPSMGAVNKYFTAAIVANFVISWQLPAAYRHAWQYGTITFETYSVERSFRAGAKIEF